MSNAKPVVRMLKYFSSGCKKAAACVFLCCDATVTSLFITPRTPACPHDPGLVGDL